MAGFDPVAYRASRAKDYASTGGVPAAPPPAPADPNAPKSLSSAVMKPYYDSGIITADPKTQQNQSFIRRVGEDALLLGLAPSALAATAGDLLLHPIKTAGTIATGFAEGVVDMFDADQWKAHPLLNTVNTIANITVVGGIIKAAALAPVRTAAINAAKTAAIEAGANSTMVEVAFKGVRPLKASIYEAVKTKSVEPVVTAMRPYLKNAGLSDASADAVARQAAESVVTPYLQKNSGKLAAIDAATHPLQALGRSAPYVSTPIAKLIFGTPEQSAVGKLYGSDVVSKNVPGFSLLEEWAGRQAVERGLRDNVPNRVRVMQEWVEQNPEYAALTPEQRIAHFQDYAQADLTRQKFAEKQGMEYVLTKALPQHYVDAMVDFVSGLEKGLTNSQVVEKLSENFGKDFGLHAEEVRNRLAGQLESKDRGGLTTALQGLANNQLPVTLRKLTKAETKLVQDLEGSGYRIGRAPTSKKISQAVDVTGQAYTKENLVSARTMLGRVVDRFGLSPEGVVEGTQFFGFREAFTQALLKNFGRGKSITIEGVKYPVESLTFKLEKLRQAYMANRSGIKPGIHTIADLRYSDLVKLGFSKEDATKLDAMIRESNVASPSVTGIGEALSNYVRTRNNPLSRAYNGFLRLQSDLRFKKNPMFGMQAAVESVVWGNMWAKKFPGQQALTRAFGRISGLKTPIINAAKEPTMGEQQMVLSEVMGDYNRQLRDSGMSPEIYRGVSEVFEQGKAGIPGVIERLQFQKETLDSNIWLGVAGFSNVKLTTNLMTAYAQRFGLTLDEALAFTMKDGKKVYDNPWMVENMKSAAQGIFGYKAGFLTSPLVRTLNTIWFPMRFQAKTSIQMAQWLGSLSPASRLAVMNQWTHMANWLTTPEGQNWKKKNRGMFASLFNYVFAFEGIGKSVNAATKGQLFGGNTGLIGGLPFGFVANIARDLGYMPEEVQIDLNTGLPYKRQVVKDSASFAGFVTVVENIILSMSPSMPFNTATGGAVTVSLNRDIKTFVEQVLTATTAAAVPGVDSKDLKRDLKTQRINVRPEYQKRLPFDIFSPEVAKASGFEGALKPGQFLPEVQDLKIVDKTALQATPPELGQATPPPKPAIVAGVDITSYATDPTHEDRIARIVSDIPPSATSTAVEIDDYIKARAPKSPVRGGMVKRAADKYNVSPALILAIIQNDSSFGTKGLGVKTRNPGNVGNTDSGATQKYATWEAGVNAVAKWLAAHKT